MTWTWVIFDIDGTLLRSVSKHEDAFYLACNAYGHRIPEKLKEKLTGMSTIDKVEKLIEKKIFSPNLAHAIIKKKNELALSVCLDDFICSQSHIDAMFMLKKHKINIGLCSNSNRDFVDLFVAKCGYGDLISFALSGTDVERKKPAPDVYLLAKKHVIADTTMVFEDSNEGLISATAAGFKHITKIDGPERISREFISQVLSL